MSDEIEGLEKSINDTQSPADTSIQQRFHEAVQGTNNGDDILEGAVLSNWVVMAQWVSVDGQKYICRVAHEDAARWEVAGLLHEGLYEFDDDGEEDE